MKILALMLALILGAPSAFSQQRDGRAAPSKNQGMTPDQRQRMRNDMQDVYRDRNRQDRPQQQRQLSPQQREQLRRDIDDANRNLKR